MSVYQFIKGQKRPTICQVTPIRPKEIYTLPKETYTLSKETNNMLGIKVDASCLVPRVFVCSLARSLARFHARRRVGNNNLLQIWTHVVSVFFFNHVWACLSWMIQVRCNTLQHTATRFNTLQHTATHCSTLQHTATHYNTLQHTATHCNTLQHTAAHCSTLQHTATHCNTLQHAATHSGIASCG